MKDCKLEKPITMTMRIAEANKVNRNCHLINEKVMEAIIETIKDTKVHWIRRADKAE